MSRPLVLLMCVFSIAYFLGTNWMKFLMSTMFTYSQTMLDGVFLQIKIYKIKSDRNSIGKCLRLNETSAAVLHVITIQY